MAVVQGSVYLFGGMTEAGPSNHLYRLEALEAGLLTIGQWRLVTGNQVQRHRGTIMSDKEGYLIMSDPQAWQV